MNNFLRTGFDRRTLLKIVNRHSYNNKSTALLKIRHCKGKCIFVNHNLTLGLIVIFNSFIVISILKRTTKIFCISYYSRKNVWKFLRYSPQCLCLYILSSIGANQLQVLYKDF